MGLPAGVVVVPLPRIDAATHPDLWLLEGIVEVDRATMLADAGDDDAAPTVTELRHAVVPDDYLDRVTFVALERDRGRSPAAVVGHAHVALPLTDNRHLALVGVAVRPSHQRRGIGGALWRHVERVAREAGRGTLMATTDHPAALPHDTALRIPAGTGAVGASGSTAFAQARGFSLAQVERRSRLDVPMTPAARARLTAMVAERTSGQRDYDVVTWHGRFPDRWLDDVALLMRRMSTDVPLGDLDYTEDDWDAARVRALDAQHAARGLVPWVAAVRHVPSDALVAFSILLAVQERPELAFQEDTLVIREHRGHRLGALVKLANHDHLVHGDPRVRRVLTWNAQENAPMLAINVAMGFEVAGTNGEWQRVEDVGTGD